MGKDSEYEMSKGDAKPGATELTSTPELVNFICLSLCQFSFVPKRKMAKPFCMGGISLLTL